MQFVRALHTVPRLTSVGTKVEGLMSPQQFKLAWNDHQGYLTSMLSLKTVDTELETRAPLSIALSCGKDTLKQDVAFYASMAHNNHMFFEQLKDKDAQNPLDVVKPQLRKAIEQSFGSFDELRTQMLYSADVLYGNGWTFLVENADKSLRVVSCNNGGSPYAYAQNQSLDLNGPIAESDLVELGKNKEAALAGVKDYSMPLLVLNVWQHAYLLDYGVTGKADYLEKLWGCIDWNVVNKRMFSALDM